MCRSSCWRLEFFLAPKSLSVQFDFRNPFLSTFRTAGDCFQLVLLSLSPRIMMCRSFAVSYVLKSFMLNSCCSTQPWHRFSISQILFLFVEEVRIPLLPVLMEGSRSPLVPICCRGQNSPAPCFGGRVEITPGVFLFVIEVSLPLLPVSMEGSRSPLVPICCRGQNSPVPCFG